MNILSNMSLNYRSLQGLDNSELEVLLEQLKAQKGSAINQKLLSEVTAVSKRKHNYSDTLSL